MTTFFNENLVPFFDSSPLLLEPELSLSTDLCDTHNSLSVFEHKSVENESPITQKAKGVFLLQNKKTVLNLLGLQLSVNKHLVFKAIHEFGPSCFNFPVFVRPCPVVPRHGFVDSVVCKDHKTLNQVIENTRKVEPNAEVLITKPLEAHHNVVFAGNHLSIGNGNDGATSGTNCSSLYVNEDVLWERILSSSTPSDILAENTIPFYEFVITETSSFLVQIRSGPGVPSSKDFVPQDIKVETVVRAGGDLLEWEEKMKNVDPTKTVVNHVGGSLSSHYAIHCVVNNIAVLTTREPVVGETLSKTTSVDQTTPATLAEKKDFVESFKKGFCIWQSYAPTPTELLYLVLAVLHNMYALLKHRDFSLLGQVLGIFCKICFAVSFGESRHHKNRAQLKKAYSKTFPFDKHVYVLPGNRDTAYQSLLKTNVKNTVAAVEKAYYLFHYCSWSGSFGGKPWENCTKEAISLYNLCLEGDIQKAVSQFNVVINMAHNGGRYLNKLISVEQMDEAAHNSSEFVFNNLKALCQTRHFLHKAEEKVIEESTDIWFTPITIEPLEAAKSVENLWIYVSEDYKTVWFSTDRGYTLHLAPEKMLRRIQKCSDFYDISQCDMNKDGKRVYKLESIPFWWTISGVKVLSKKLLFDIICVVE